MRIFIVVLILILNLQSLTKADDISDFEIEGILEEVIEQYNIHSEQEHGIAYTKETLEHRFTALQISQ